MSLLVEIEKKLGDFHLQVSLEAQDNVLSLLGASGCGKSMTLKCIAGICRPDSGRIILNGTPLFDSAKQIDVPPQSRRIGYLFQQYALFPNMTVAQNIAAGVRDKKQVRTAVAEMIDKMRLNGLERLRPHQLSGGQQQRTALARILVNEPEVLLLDEPLSALDCHLRFQMEEELRALTKSFQKPMLLVSHDQAEVYRLSDRVALMAHGQVTAIGDKKTVFAAPQTRSGAILTGFQNISSAERLDETHILAKDWGIPLAVSHTACDAVAIRAQAIRTGAGTNSLRCRVLQEIENPFSVTLTLSPHPKAAAPLVWELGRAEWEAMRCEEIQIHLPEAQIQCLKES